MATVRDSLFDSYFKDEQVKHPNKVTVVGAGSVGMACVFSILTKGVSNDVVIVDKNENLATGEVLDLQHGSLFLQGAQISGGGDFSLSRDSRICIVAAGVRQKEGESRLNLVQRNVDVVKTIIQELVKYSPNTIIIMVSNPVDVLTYVAWKLSGFPKHRVLGSGTSLDTSRAAAEESTGMSAETLSLSQRLREDKLGNRFNMDNHSERQQTTKFRGMLGERLGACPTSCHGYIIGEHGDSSIPVWSTVNVAGVRLREINPDVATAKDKERIGDIHRDVVDAAYKVIKLKGYTSWAIGLSVAHLTQAILNDTHEVQVVSVCVKGHHGITDDDVFMSLPATLTGSGIGDILRLRLSDHEKELFQKSAAVLKEVTDGVKL